MLNHLKFNEFIFNESIRTKLNKLYSLISFEKYITFFWLLGPFFYLIERDPADLWLSSIVIFFLIRCKIKKDWDWANQWWFRFAVIFWCIANISALLSPDAAYSLSQGIVWIRFPLYAAAAQVWLGRDRDMRLLMLLSIVLGILIMNGILLAEVIFDPKLRLTWPYGDTVPGAYLAKLGLPVLCILFVINIKKVNVIISIILFFSISMVFLTGERTHLILLICSCMMSTLFWKPKVKGLTICATLTIGIILSLSYFNPGLMNRLQQIPEIVIKYYAAIGPEYVLTQSDFIVTNKTSSLLKNLDSKSMNFIIEDIDGFGDTSGPYGNNQWQEYFVKINGEIIKYKKDIHPYELSSSDFEVTNITSTLAKNIDSKSMNFRLTSLIGFGDTNGPYGNNQWQEYFVKINDEIIKYSKESFNSDNTNNIFIITRGFANTSPSSHLKNSKVTLLATNTPSYKSLKKARKIFVINRAFANTIRSSHLKNSKITLLLSNSVAYKLYKHSQHDIGIASYWGSWRGGIQQGLDTPFIGIGPSGTRKTCKDLPVKTPAWLPGKNYCGNHPHNFYIQLFAETGILGLIFGTLMVYSLIRSCLLARKENNNCLMASIAFVIPFAIFFPIQQFGSFFGQWGNLFIWFAIGFALSNYQGWIKEKN